MKMEQKMLKFYLTHPPRCAILSMVVKRRRDALASVTATRIFQPTVGHRSKCRYFLWLVNKFPNLEVEIHENRMARLCRRSLGKGY